MAGRLPEDPAFQENRLLLVAPDSSSEGLCHEEGGPPTGKRSLGSGPAPPLPRCAMGTRSCPETLSPHLHMGPSPQTRRGERAVD